MTREAELLAALKEIAELSRTMKVDENGCELVCYWLSDDPLVISREAITRAEAQDADMVGEVERLAESAVYDGARMFGDASDEGMWIEERHFHDFALFLARRLAPVASVASREASYLRCANESMDVIEELRDQLYLAVKELNEIKTAGGFLMPTLDEIDPQPVAPGVVEALDDTTELLSIGWKWLDNHADGVVCTDRSCIRCKVADVLFALEKSFPDHALRSAGKGEA